MDRKTEIKQLLEKYSGKTKPLYDELRVIEESERKSKHGEKILELAKNKSDVIFTALIQGNYGLFIGKLHLHTDSEVYFDGLIVEYSSTSSDDEGGHEFILKDMWEEHYYDIEDIYNIQIGNKNIWPYLEFKEIFQRLSHYLS